MSGDRRIDAVVAVLMGFGKNHSWDEWARNILFAADAVDPIRNSFGAPDVVLKWPETRPPCPWCKEVPELNGSGSYGPWRVKCMTWKCGVRPHTRECNSVTEAWEAWESAFRA